MKSFLKYQGKTSPKLRKAVISGLGDIESLIDVANHGADGGHGDFCYHSDTVAFYKKNKKDILKMACNDAFEFGTTLTAMVSTFSHLKSNSDITTHEIDRVFSGELSDEYNTNQIFNVMTWYALESVAQDYQSYKEEN
jgi:hypothetical protein